jgi:hypothetical protein
MSKIHQVQSIDFTDNELVLSVDNQTYYLPLIEISEKLTKASDMERKVYKISPSGYGIHWLLIDEDLSIDGLIKLANNLAIQSNKK